MGVRVVGWVRINLQSVTHSASANPPDTSTNALYQRTHPLVMLPRSNQKAVVTLLQRPAASAMAHRADTGSGKETSESNAVCHACHECM